MIDYGEIPLSWKQWRRTKACLLLLFMLRGIPAAVAITVTPSEGTYTREFFEEHRTNEHVYPFLVEVMTGTASSHVGRDNFSVLDVGCGHGFLVEAWRRSGTSESYCMEGSEEAIPLWPAAHMEKYYQITDLTSQEALDAVPPTDVVTTFEVGEHLPGDRADHFAGLLVRQAPSILFFGAATVNQDLGKNPSHVNEQPFAFWIKVFRRHNYVLDPWETLRLRLSLNQKPMFKAWWYPKNILVFVPESRQEQLDRTMVQNDLGGKLDQMHQWGLGSYQGVSDTFRAMWRRDWLEFAGIFHDELAAAKRRQLQAVYEL